MQEQGYRTSDNPFKKTNTLICFNRFEMLLIIYDFVSKVHLPMTRGLREFGLESTSIKLRIKMDGVVKVRIRCQESGLKGEEVAAKRNISGCHSPVCA